MTPRSVLAIVLLAATALACVSLGRWQLRRAAQREAIAQAIDAGRQAPPLALNTLTRQQASAQDWQEWQPAHASGTWLDGYSVLLDNRNLQGRPGLWLATPLQLEGAPDTALLVLRGWLPRPVNVSTHNVSANLGHASALRLPENPHTVQQIQGQLRLRVPRLYELWQRGGFDASALPGVWPAGSATAPPPVVQNLELDRYAQATGLTLLPVVLEQTQRDGLPDDGLIRHWATPSLDADKNRGYALQWFGFAAIAGIAALGVVWRSRRRGPHRQAAQGKKD